MNPGLKSIQLNSTQNSEKVFDDYLAKKILTKDEYEQIASNMSKGISFFNPSFVGTQEEALRWIVDNHFLQLHLVERYLQKSHLKML